MGNWFLETVSREVRAQIQDGSHAVLLTPGQELYRAGEPLQSVYFPTSGLVAVIVTMKSGKTACTSLVGRSGVLSSAVVLDTSVAIDHALVEMEGEASRMPIAGFIALYRKNEEFRGIVNRYHAMTWVEGQQSTVCNVLHPAKQRICRWLLEARDRTGLNTLAITHDLLSNLLGVRRSTVTLIQKELGDAGVINTHRGIIDLVDLNGLRACSCECYRLLRLRAKVIFPGLPSPLDVPGSVHAKQA